MRKHLLIVFCGLLSIIEGFGQNSGTVLVYSNELATVYLDGKKVGEVNANDRLRLYVSPGDHFVKAVSINDSLWEQSSEVLGLKLGMQKVLRFEFKRPSSIASTIADLRFICPGLESIREYRDKNPGKQFSDQPAFYYAFDKGDTILLDLDLKEGVYSCSFFVSKYPENTRVVASIFLSKWEDFSFVVKEKSVYKFLIISDNYYDGIAKLRIRRKPARFESTQFATSTSKIKSIEPVEVATKKTFENKTKTRQMFPVELPENAVSFTYKISEASGSTSLCMSLLAQTYAQTDSNFAVSIDNLKGYSGKISVNVLDEENAVLFKKQSRDQSVSFQSLKHEFGESGVGMIKVEKGKKYWLGIESQQGIDSKMNIEIVALLPSEKYIMDKKQAMPEKSDYPLVLRRKDFRMSLVSGGNVKSNIKLLPVEYHTGYIFY